MQFLAKELEANDVRVFVESSNSNVVSLRPYQYRFGGIR